LLDGKTNRLIILVLMFLLFRNWKVSNPNRNFWEY
jgi:hypothetical protein